MFGAYRKDVQADAMRDEHIEPVRCDLVRATIDSLRSVMAGVDAVIFTAGANGGGDEMTDIIDGQGVVLASSAAREAGCNRFLVVSAFPDAWRERRMPPDFEHYMFVKRQADVHLASTDLDWVILRPGTLLDSPGTAHVRVGLAIPYGDVSRDDVAATLVALVEKPEIRRVILELTCGEEQIDKAIERVSQGL